MTYYAYRRLLGLMPVLFGISLLAFLLLRLIPGDPAMLILGERATPAQWQPGIQVLAHFRGRDDRQPMCDIDRSGPDRSDKKLFAGLGHVSGSLIRENTQAKGGSG
mgnify:CR=1 FL=1